MKKSYLLLGFLVFNLYVHFTYSQNADAQKALEEVDRRFFIENKGQWHSDVLYLCRMGGLDVWITKYGMNYTFYKIEKDSSLSSAAYRNDHDGLLNDQQSKDKFDHEGLKNTTLLGHRVLLELENHNPSPVREGKKQMEGYYNYFIGNDPSKYATYVGLYKEAVIKNVYNGIDIRYYFDKGNLRYDFVVQPYADASQIQFKLRGQDKVYTKGESKLCFTTRFGEVELADLKTYQENKVVQSKFVKNGNTWAFALGEYDRTKPLIIDPLVYSTFIGGSGWDVAHGIFVDNTNCVYIAGEAKSTDYDITPGAFQSIKDPIISYPDAMVTKLNSTGSSLIFSTYVGGNGDDIGRAIYVDASGCSYVVGNVWVHWGGSSTYPTTAPNCFQCSPSWAGYDAFAFKLNSTGTALIYSTFLRGGGNDNALDIAVDASNNAYIVGTTEAPDFPTTPGVFQTTKNSSNDIFVLKLNSLGNSAIFSTYLGGNNNDEGTGIAIDNMGFVYVTGHTLSTDFPTTPGVVKPAYTGSWEDVFLTKLNPTGTSLVFSTYFGGTSEDKAFDVEVDASNCPYITGHTLSSDFTVTAGAFQTTKGSTMDVFVTKFNSTATGLSFSTFIGGGYNESSKRLFVDANNHVYITGWTRSLNFPLTPDAVQSTHSEYYSNNDVFVTALDATGTALIFSTYLGGCGDPYSTCPYSGTSDFGEDVFADASGSIYVAGGTWSGDFDVTPGAFQTTHEGPLNAFVTKLFPASLPVQKISLKANYTPNGIELEWQNTIQQSIKQFVIQKWQNNTWEGIAQVSSNTYSHQDREGIYTGATLMYRIQAINKDGQSYYSNVETITVPEQNQSFALYPNPAQNSIVIENFTATAQEYELADVSGKILQVYTLPQGKNNIQINLPKGMYFVRERKQGKTEKLIVE